jgi:hypothetical protein
MSKSISRLTVLALSGAIVGLLLLPAAGQAATIFGSQLKNDPTENSCDMVGTCTIVARIHSAPPEGDPYSGGAPVSGVITKFRTRAYAVEEPGQITFRLGNLTLTDPNDLESALATSAGTGPSITIVPEEDGEVPITEVPAQLPVKQGQQLAVDITNSIAIIYNSNGDKRSYMFAPTLVEGAGQRSPTEVLNELQVQATIEPDADNDGFGDETQDQCPTQAATQGPCDTAAPGVSGFKVANGKKISYSLSEAATVKFKLEKKSKGRKVGKKCVKQTPSNKSKKSCTLFKQIASFGGPGKAGANQASIPKKLGPGTYRLTMTARDAVGNETTKTTTFKVAAKKKGKKKK